MVTWDTDNAAHLLSRAGFGGSEKDVAKYVRYGQAKAVDVLVRVTGIPAKGPGKSDDDPDDLASLRTWWVKRMLKQDTRRLQEKMVLFWHDHFASSVRNNLHLSLQNRLFRLHGMGPMRTLLLEVTRDPCMLDFLDGNVSTVNKPNENYGRELMELFALGVTDVHGVENYTQTDVEQLARSLTGFQIVADAGTFVPARYDGGQKILFQGTGHQMGPDVLGVLDAAQQPLPAVRNVIDGLLAHRDSDGALTMPRFLAKKLWEWFAYPGPDVALLDELTGDFIANGFVVRDLLRAIFLHDEFYSARAKTETVKNPVEFAIHALRALGASTNATTLPDHLEAMGLALFDPPNVNGWPHGLAWLSSGLFLARLEFAQALAAGRDGTLKLVPKKLVPPGTTDPASTVDRILALLGMTAKTPAASRQALIDHFGGAPSVLDPVVLETKVRGAVMLALALPGFHVH